MRAIGQNVKRFKKGTGFCIYRQEIRGFCRVHLFAWRRIAYACGQSHCIKTVQYNLWGSRRRFFQGCFGIFISRKGNIRNGQKALIFGASGGVALSAVQFAKYYGRKLPVYAVLQILDISGTLGADKVIDYTKEDFTKTGESYDFIFWCPLEKDIAQNFSAKRRLLRTEKFISVDDTPKIHIEDLVLLKELVETGKIKPVIDRCYPLEQDCRGSPVMSKKDIKGEMWIITNLMEIRSLSGDDCCHDRQSYFKKEYPAVKA